MGGVGVGSKGGTPTHTLSPAGAQLARPSPLSPKVPEMDGCSPVNFLGVFCFLPDSGERKWAAKILVK